MTTESCDEIRSQLPDHALGTLTETEVARIRRHLRGCAACRAEAAQLDQGVATFASVVHVADPPEELKDRVMAVLSEEWSEAQAKRREGRRSWFGIPLPALAAAMVLIVGLVGWGTVSQVHAWNLREDAESYHRFLDALGGRDVRVGQIHASAGVTLEGSVILYDSEVGQSWVLVFAKSQTAAELKVAVQNGNGGTIEIPFPLRFEEDGEGWTGMVSRNDLTAYTHVVFLRDDGTVVATAEVLQA